MNDAFRLAAEHLPHDRSRFPVPAVARENLKRRASTAREAAANRVNVASWRPRTLGSCARPFTGKLARAALYLAILVLLTLFVALVGAIVPVVRATLTRPPDPLQSLAVLSSLVVSFGVLITLMLRVAEGWRNDGRSFRSELKDLEALLGDLALSRRIQGVHGLRRCAEDTRSPARRTAVVGVLAEFIRHHEPEGRRGLAAAPAAWRLTGPGAFTCPRDVEAAFAALSWLAAAPAVGRPDLSGANLFGYRLDGVCLSGALLDGADLRKTSLDGADLHGARCHGADLRGASLVGADVREACFHEARMDST